MSKLAKVQKCIEKKKASELVKLAKDSDKEVRLVAIAGMEQLSSHAFLNELVAMMDDPDEEIRIAVIHAIGEARDRGVDTHLRYYLERESREPVREAILEALKKMPKEK